MCPMKSDHHVASMIPNTENVAPMGRRKCFQKIAWDTAGKPMQSSG